MYEYKAGMMKNNNLLTMFHQSFQLLLLTFQIRVIISSVEILPEKALEREHETCSNTATFVKQMLRTNVEPDYIGQSLVALYFLLVGKV